MSQPILSIRDERGSQTQAVANVLPARIHHNGPVDPIESFWTPTQGETYLRGRKLQGKAVKLPEQCRGVVLQRKDDAKDEKSRLVAEADVDGEDQGPATGTMHVTAEFDEMVVWGHEAVVDASGDAYVRGIEEWLQLSAKMTAGQRRSEALKFMLSRYVAAVRCQAIQAPAAAGVEHQILEEPVRPGPPTLKSESAAAPGRA